MDRYQKGMIAAVLAIVSTGAVFAQDLKPGETWQKPVQPGDDAMSLSAEPGSNGTMEITQPKLIFTIKADGTVVLAPGVTMDEATKAFWDSIGKGAPCATKEGK